MKPSIPKGTRDFNAEVVRRRNYILDIIKKAFALHAYQPLETPAFEKLETLMGKYGEEGDKLIFKILNNGLDQAGKEEKSRAAFEKVLTGKNQADLTERALKYDLTIPFARYVAMNFGQLSMPFKRYQIQNVWRADRPQRGRYREFTQCDADIVGSKSILNEIELSNIYIQVFEELGINIELCLNHRKILSALATHCGKAEMLTSIAIAIDKLDKIGLEKALDELRAKDFEENAIEKIKAYLEIGLKDGQVEAVEQLLGHIPMAQEAIEELKVIQKHCPTVKVDVTLARGLNYYTGCIFEVKPLNIKMGSIGGGGRYDDLTGLFGVKDVPGVGISFGVDRIYDVLEEQDKFPENLQKSVDLLILNLKDSSDDNLLSISQKLRKHEISVLLFPDKKKIDKQYKFAEKNRIPFVLTAENSNFILKDIKSGEKKEVADIKFIIDLLKA